MTEEQKKAIDACKDQAAQEVISTLNGYKPSIEKIETFMKAPLIDRAMQLYGEQCRKEAYALGWNNRGLPSWQHPPLLPEN